MKQWFNDNRGFLLLLMLFGLFRTAVADWNPVPTGSMRPTILEGDVVLVNRLAYDLKVPLTDVSLVRLGEPKRGDIVTFTSPLDGTRLIKRLVALPGDMVEMRDEVLIINHEAAYYDDVRKEPEKLVPGLEVTAMRAQERFAGTRVRSVQFLPSVSAQRSFDPVTVPPGHYFMLGDNRDNSADSRFIGFVPRAQLIGRAGHVLVSADITTNWWPRFSRIGATLI